MTTATSINLAQLTPAQGVIFTGLPSSGEAGPLVSSAGDVNKDGYDDILLSAPGYSGTSETSTSYTGIVYLIYGKSNLIGLSLTPASLSSTQGVSFSCISTDDDAFSTYYHTGYSVSSAGDINADGYDDILIGDGGMEPNSPGHVFLIYGNLSSNLVTINLCALEPSIGISVSISSAGITCDYYNDPYTVSSAGDVNGDGILDILVGDSTCNTVNSAYSGPGVSYLIYGNASLAKIESSQIITYDGGVTPGGYLGWSVSSAGDINKDGYDDFIMSAPDSTRADDDGASKIGIVFLIYGGKNLEDLDLTYLVSTQGISITGAQSGDQTGYSVSGVGDVNNDGYDDVIIGAPGYSSSGGIVYLIYGSSSLRNINLAFLGTAGITIIGETASQAGYSVSNAGDLNKDNYTDIIIGAPGYSSSKGRAYIIYGNNNLTNITLNNLTVAQGILITGANEGDMAGFSVSGAGDINNDGYDDVIIGASGYYVNEDKPNENGAAYLIYGAVSGVITSSPTSSPTGLPSAQPTSIPSNQPTEQPSAKPTAKPSVQPTQPSSQPSAQPTSTPSVHPTMQPTAQPSSVPTVQPSSYPTKQPTMQPTGQPSTQPTMQPIAKPSAQPTMQPSVQPTKQPSSQPSAQPSNSPTSQPTMQPTRQPSIQPTMQPTAAPSATPTIQPSAQPTRHPTAQPSTQPSQPSSQPTSQPSSFPTAVPTNSPSKAAEIIINDNSNPDSQIITSLVSSFGSLLGALALYFGPSWILNEWGYKFKIITNIDEDLKANEIGLTLQDNKLMAVHKKNTYPIHVESKNNHGISERLYKIIVDQINKEPTNYKYIYNNLDKEALLEKQLGLQYQQTNPLGLRFNLFCNTGKLVAFKKEEHENSINQYTLNIDNNANNGVSRGLYYAIAKEYSTLSRSPLLYSEQYQLRDFLLTHSRIHPQTVMPIYTDLGCFKGFAYTCCLLLKQYQHSYDGRLNEESFERIKLAIEKDTDLSITIKSLKSTDSGHISMKDMSPHLASLQGDFRSSTNPILYENIDQSLRTEGHKTTQAVLGVDSTDLRVSSTRHTKDLESGDSKASILCIDALIDPAHVRVQDKEFARFGEHLMMAYKELSFVFSHKMNRAQLLLKDSSTKTDALTMYRNLASTNKAPFSTSDNLMISIFTSKQIIEHLPIIKYTAQGTINLLGYNITLPDISDYTPLLISIHLLLGNAAALMLPGENIATGIIASTIDTTGYAMSLTVFGFLKNQTIADNSVDLAMQCGITVAAYTLPSVATCLLTKLVLPTAPCTITGYDVLSRGSLGTIHCYSNYKAVAQPSVPTTTDILVTYIADVIAVYTLSSYLGVDTSSSTALMLSVKNSMSVMAAVVAVDSMSRMMMDVVPQEIKADYVDPILNCAGDLYACLTDNT